MNVFKHRKLSQLTTATIFVISVLAQSASAEIKDKFWLTDDGDAIVATGACSPGSKELCGIIVGLPGAKGNPKIEQARDELCGLPILWNFKPTSKPGKYDKGRILDPETEKQHRASFTDRDVFAEISVWPITLKWKRVSSILGECDGEL